jgi:hypothetical protein
MLLGALALVVVAAPANAQTPSFEVSCDKLAVKLLNYKADTSSAKAVANKVVVTVGGVVVASEQFGKDYVKTFDLPAHQVPLPVNVDVVAWDAPASAVLSPTWNAVSEPCGGLASTEALNFTEQLGCESAVVNLTSLGREAKTVVTRNGQQVWAGTVGQAGAPVDTGALAAVAGDKFAVAEQLGGGKLDTLGGFTYVLPAACALPAGVPADLDFTKAVSCKDIAVKLENAGRSVEAVVLKNGEQVWQGALAKAGASAVTEKLAAKPGDVFSVAYLAGAQKVLAGQFTYAVPDACGALPAAPALSDAPADLDIAKNLSCEGAVVTLTNAGNKAEAIVTKNGEQVWKGTVGGAISAVDTGNLQAKAGDVFAVRYLDGAGAVEKAKALAGTFTYQAPAACGLLSKLPAVTPETVTSKLNLAATPEMTCEGIVYNLKNAGGAMKAVVTRNGQTLWGNAVGGKVDSLTTGMLPAKAGDVFQVGYLAGNLPLNLGEKVAWVAPAACSASTVAFDEHLDCAGAAGMLTNKGAAVKAVVTQNGKKVWDGVVGGAASQVPIQGIPAKVGDVFAVQFGDKLETLKRFTYAVPGSCSLPDALPAAAFTDTCEGVTAALANSGDQAVDMLVQARASAENAWANVGAPVSVPGGTSVAEAQKVLVPATVPSTEVRTVVDRGQLQVGQIHNWTKNVDCSAAAVPAIGAGDLGLDVARDCHSLTVTLANAAESGADKLDFVVDHTSEAVRRYTVLPGTTATYTTPLKAGQEVVVSLGDKVREIDLTPGEECADAAPLPVDAPAAEAAGVTVSEGGLPVTGSSVTVLIGLGAALVASGLFFALVSRRRSLGLHSS